MTIRYIDRTTRRVRTTHGYIVRDTPGGVVIRPDVARFTFYVPRRHLVSVAIP